MQYQAEKQGPEQKTMVIRKAAFLWNVHWRKCSPRSQCTSYKDNAVVKVKMCIRKLLRRDLDDLINFSLTLSRTFQNCWFVLFMLTTRKPHQALISDPCAGCPFILCPEDLTDLYFASLLPCFSESGLHWGLYNKPPVWLHFDVVKCIKHLIMHQPDTLLFLVLTVCHNYFWQRDEYCFTLLLKYTEKIIHLLLHTGFSYLACLYILPLIYFPSQSCTSETKYSAQLSCLAHK